LAEAGLADGGKRDPFALRHIGAPHNGVDPADPSVNSGER